MYVFAAKKKRKLDYIAEVDYVTCIGAYIKLCDERSAPPLHYTALNECHHYFWAVPTTTRVAANDAMHRPRSPNRQTACHLAWLPLLSPPAVSSVTRHVCIIHCSPRHRVVRRPLLTSLHVTPPTFSRLPILSSPPPTSLHPRHSAHILLLPLCCHCRCGYALAHANAPAPAPASPSAPPLLRIAHPHPNTNTAGRREKTIRWRGSKGVSCPHLAMTSPH